MILASQGRRVSRLGWWGLLFLFAAGAGQAGPGVIVGNGGGLAEQNFAYALAQLPHVVELCEARLQECLSSREEIQAFERIRSGLARELQTDGLLRFESCEGKSAPDCPFLIDGQLRVAVTGTRPGAPIRINLDLIYPKDSSGKVQPLDTGTALAILTHELGHHQGLKDHQFLDLLGARLRLLLLMRSETFRVDTFGDTYEPAPMADILLRALHSDALPDDEMRGAQSWLALSDGTDLFDINPLLERQLYCPTDWGGRERVLGYRLYDLKGLERVPAQGAGRLYRLKASIFMVCENTRPRPGDLSPGRGDNGFSITLGLPFELRSDAGGHLAWHLVPGRAALSVINRPPASL